MTKQRAWKHLGLLVGVLAFAGFAGCSNSTSPSSASGGGSPTPAVSLAAQAGSISSGSAAQVTFTVTTSNVTAGTAGVISWYTSSAGTTTATLVLNTCIFNVHILQALNPCG